jgi:hypothetical protein
MRETDLSASQFNYNILLLHKCYKQFYSLNIRGIKDLLPNCNNKIHQMASRVRTLCV